MRTNLRWGHRLAVGSVATVAVVIALSHVSYAYWSSQGAGTGNATTGTLVQVTSLSAHATDSTDATISWADLMNPSTTTYKVQAGTTTYCSGLTATSCTASGLSPGANYTFTVTPMLKSWTGPSESASQITTPAPQSTPTISSPTSANTQSVKAGRSVKFNIVGTNFASGMTVSLTSGSDSVFSITAWSYTDFTTISVTVKNSSGNNGTPYSAGLIVTNVDGGTATSANCITN